MSFVPPRSHGRKLIAFRRRGLTPYIALCDNTAGTVRPDLFQPLAVFVIRSPVMRCYRFPLLLAVCTLGLAVVPCRAADEEHPFKKAVVGDWASYKLTTETQGQKTQMDLKQTLAAKDDKEATIKITATVNGQEAPAQEQKIDLTKPYDLFTARLPAGIDLKVKKEDEGKETLTIGKTKYACKWQTVTVTSKPPDQDKPVESEVKIWTCPDVPLGGIVKMETKLYFPRLS